MVGFARNFTEEIVDDEFVFWIGDTGRSAYSAGLIFYLDTIEILTKEQMQEMATSFAQLLAAKLKEKENASTN